MMNCASYIIFVIVAFLLQSSKADLFGTVQAVAVQGSLLCNGKPSVSTKVKLYDVDSKY